MKTFRDAVREQNFVLTAECLLKPDTNAEAIRLQAELLRDCVDGVVLKDNQFGALHMSTVAAARLMIDNEMDPIVQLSCRNRNRIALLGDLLGAAALTHAAVEALASAKKVLIRIPQGWIAVSSAGYCRW